MGKSQSNERASTSTRQCLRVNGFMWGNPVKCMVRTCALHFQFSLQDLGNARWTAFKITEDKDCLSFEGWLQVDFWKLKKSKTVSLLAVVSLVFQISAAFSLEKFHWSGASRCREFLSSLALSTCAVFGICGTNASPLWKAKFIVCI